MLVGLGVDSHPPPPPRIFSRGRCTCPLRPGAQHGHLDMRLPARAQWAVGWVGASLAREEGFMRVLCIVRSRFLHDPNPVQILGATPLDCVPASAVCPSTGSRYMAVLSS